MKKFLQGIAIAIYFSILFIFCILYTFPYDTLSNYLNYLIQNKISDKIQIQSINYSPLFSFKIDLDIDGWQAYLANNNKILAYITPNLFNIGSFSAKLFSSKVNIMDFHIGFKHIIKKPSLEYALINFHKLEINSIDLYSNNVILKGEIKGIFELKKNKQNLLNFQSNITGLKLLLSAYGIKKEIPFLLEKLEGNINKTKASIQKTKIKSPYFTVVGRGYIYFKKNILNSIISIKGTIDLDLKNIKKDLISFPFNNKSQLKYSLSGTLDSITYNVY